MNLFKAILALRSIGLAAAVRTLRYSFYRDRMNRAIHPVAPEVPAVSPGALRDTQPLSNGELFQFEHAELEVRFLKTDIVRLSWTPGLEPVAYALAQNGWPQTPFEREENEQEIVLRSKDLKVSIGKRGEVIFSDWEENCLRTETPPQLRRSGTNSLEWTHKVALNPQEHIYGLGEQAAPLNRRGAGYRLWNSDPGGSYGQGANPLYAGIPTYLSLSPQGSYLVFYENPYPSDFVFPAHSIDNDADPAHASFGGGMLRYYFMPGPPSLALERFTELTGRAPLPPRWALGYHQCRWGYKNEADVREVSDGFIEHQMPLSAIHLDIDYMDGYRVFTVDRDRFPDLKQLADDLEAEGVKLVAILDPGVKRDPQYDLFRQGADTGVFAMLPDGKAPSVGLVWPGEAVFPDFTDPKVRRWWGDQYPFLLEKNIAGFWHDMNEPSSFAAWGDMTLPLVTRHAMEGRGGDHLEAHNLYGLLMNRAGYEGLRRLRPSQRHWIVSRSGWAGVQRYAWNWTGDVESSWEALRMTIATVLGLGLSGQPFSGSDIGGFSGDPSAELHLRWFQMAAFMPFFRTHSAVGTRRREPWVFGEPTTSILREFLKLRYRLMPYLYTLAWEASQSGAPPVRPMFWHFEEDPALWKVDDQFLLGEALLVAPVVEDGAAARRVHLPKGGWYGFWDNKIRKGPQSYESMVSLEEIPVFVRAGSILPMEEDQELVLHIYPDSQYLASGQVYLDPGDGETLSEADWRLDRFTLSQQAEHLELDWQTSGQFPFPYPGLTLQFHGERVEKVWYEGRELACQENRVALVI